MECACGCGQPTATKQARFIMGHWQRSAEYRGLRDALRRDVDPNPSGLCQCGCGTETSYFARYHRHARFVKGHEHRLRCGARSPGWKGGRIRTKAGYIMVKSPSHPNCRSDGYVFEHRLVWEQANGRLLRRDESVHHLNGIKDDNRPENLTVSSHADHMRHHHPDLWRHVTPEMSRRALTFARTDDPEEYRRRGRQAATTRKARGWFKRDRPS